jgi:hypothetical protein
MPPSLALIKAFFQQATVQGARSTVLRPLAYLLSICAASVLGAVYLQAPFWLVVLLAVFTGLTILLYMGAFVYCLFKDRDALRSERFSIQKLAIQKGFVGDSTSGVFTIDEAAEQRALLAPASKAPEESKK